MDKHYWTRWIIANSLAVTFLLIVLITVIWVR